MRSWVWWLPTHGRSIYDTYLRLEAGQRDENVAFCFLRGYSYSQPQGTVFGSLFGTLLVIFGIGLLAYSCFLPRRCKRSPSDVDEVDKVPSSPPPPPPPPQDFVTVGAGHLPWICTYPPTRLPSQKLIHTRSHKTQPVHKAPHLPITRGQRA